MASQPRLFRLSEVAITSPASRLTPDLLHRGPPRSALVTLARGERKQVLRPLPGIRDVDEKSTAPLEQLRSDRVTKLARDPAESGERPRLDEHVARGLREFRRLGEERGGGGQVALEEREVARQAGGARPIGIGHGAGGESLIDPAASLGRAAPGVPIAADPRGGPSGAPRKPALESPAHPGAEIRKLLLDKGKPDGGGRPAQPGLRLAREPLVERTVPLDHALELDLVELIPPRTRGSSRASSSGRPRGGRGSCRRARRVCRARRHRPPRPPRAWRRPRRPRSGRTARSRRRR